MEPGLIVLFPVLVLGDRGAAHRPDRAATDLADHRAARSLFAHARRRIHFLVPFVDKVRANIDLREQVVSFPPQPVITSDNLVVNIDTGHLPPVIDAKSAVYEIANFIQGIEQPTVTTLRNVIGSLDLEQTLTSRDQINGQLRGSLDEATGKLGHPRQPRRISRPSTHRMSVQESMEKQMNAERDRRARSSTPRASRRVRSSPPRVRSSRRSCGPRVRPRPACSKPRPGAGSSRSSDAIHPGKPTQKLLAHQYLQVLPQLARGDPTRCGSSVRGHRRPARDR